jgi:transposase
MVKLNPRQARRFAEALRPARQNRPMRRRQARPHGRGARVGASPRRQPDDDELKELLGPRDALIKDRLAALNRRKTALSALIKRQLAQRLRQIDA